MLILLNKCVLYNEVWNFHLLRLFRSYGLRLNQTFTSGSFATKAHSILPYKCLSSLKHPLPASSNFIPDYFTDQPFQKSTFAHPIPQLPTSPELFPNSPLPHQAPNHSASSARPLAPSVAPSYPGYQLPRPREVCRPGCCSWRFLSTFQGSQKTWHLCNPWYVILGQTYKFFLSNTSVQSVCALDCWLAVAFHTFFGLACLFKEGIWNTSHNIGLSIKFSPKLSLSLSPTDEGSATGPARKVLPCRTFEGRESTTCFVFACVCLVLLYVLCRFVWFYNSVDLISIYVSKDIGKIYNTI